MENNKINENPLETKAFQELYRKYNGYNGTDAKPVKPVEVDPETKELIRKLLDTPIQNSQEEKGKSR